MDLLKNEKNCYTNHISWRYVKTDKKNKLITACPLEAKPKLKKLFE